MDYQRESTSDRTTCPSLISHFIDPEVVFLFGDVTQVAEREQAIP